jgi:ABC-type multidrug transport system fused ATPase/permease subunit
MKSILNIFNNLEKKEIRRLLFIFLILFITLFLEFLGISMFLPIISLLFKEDFYLKLNNVYFLSGLNKQQVINYSLLLIVFIYLIKNIFFLYFSYLKKKLFSDIHISFTSRIYSHYLHSGYSQYLERNNSKIMREFSMIGEFISVLENLINIFIEFIVLFIIFILIFSSNINIGIFILVILFFFTILFKKVVTPKLNRYGKEVNVYQEKLVNSYLDTFGSIKDLILQKKQNYFLNIFSNIIKKNSILNVKISYLLEVPRVVVEFIIILVLSFFIFFLTISFQNLNDILVKIAFFAALVFRASPSISRIIYQSSGLSIKLDLIETVNKLVSRVFNKNITTDYSNQKKITFKKIIFKNVYFKYKIESDFILENINFSLSKNETIGIIGLSGSGKSTFIDLVSGLILPSAGKIFINGRRNSSSTIAEFQNNLAYISQKNFLINSTIKNNIAFGLSDSEIDLNRLNEAIYISRLDPFIKSLPNGYDHIVGDDGKRLSGGQRQRVILARSLYRNASIFLFDEFSSSLDKKTESEIFTDIKNNFYKKKTIIICDHDVKLLSFCDKIFKVQNKNLFQIK